MARGLREASLPKPVANGENTSYGDLPPSTRAAQLAEHFASATGRGEDKNQESFQLLLDEVLAGNVEPSTNDVPLETQVNARLIFVIVRAGIDAALSPSPFVNRSSLAKQLNDSLKATVLTIERCPAVLRAKAPLEDHPRGTNLPFHLWLIPKVLAAASFTNADGIHENVTAVIASCVRATKVDRSLVVPVDVYVKGLVRGQCKYGILSRVTNIK